MGGQVNAGKTLKLCGLMILLGDFHCYEIAITGIKLNNSSNTFNKPRFVCPTNCSACCQKPEERKSRH